VVSKVERKKGKESRRYSKGLHEETRANLIYGWDKGRGGKGRTSRIGSTERPRKNWVQG